MSTTANRVPKVPSFLNSRTDSLANYVVPPVPGLLKSKSRSDSIKMVNKTSLLSQNFTRKRDSKASSKQNSKIRRKPKPAKTNRTRKSQCQKDALWDLYKKLEGKTPSREAITDLAEDLNLKEN